jgi:hypothetical protein
MRSRRAIYAAKTKQLQGLINIFGKSHFLLDHPPFRANFGVPLRGSADIPPIDH